MSAPQIIKAAQFAAQKHTAQRRKDAQASPYINHPLAVACVLMEEGGVEDTVILCAALLHDTIEDTQTTKQELAELFGLQVAQIVMEVTDDKSLPKSVRKQEQIRHAPLLSAQAKQVKLADKICNLRDLLASPPSDWSNKRKLEYFDWAAAVVDGLRGVSLKLERCFDEVFKERSRFSEAMR